MNTINSRTPRLAWRIVLSFKRAMGTSFHFGIITEDRFSEVIDHLRSNFFFDEPLNRAVGLCPTPGTPHAELENMSLSTMKQGLSLMATQDDRIVGVALNGVTWPGDLEVAERQLALSKDHKFRSIFGLLNEANKHLSLFERYQVDKIFDMRIVSVDSAARGKGLSKEFMRRSEQLARSEGFRLIKADTTGKFSLRMAMQSGLEPVHTVMYDSYKDSDGKVIFPTSPPHDSLKIMVKLLQ